ncbi:Uncharacterised protein [Mycobacteroides abscessus subsp. massiliense]|nr:Uncharacterised protein [Mycobacteroides abscessus subsp. massiliense]
MLLPIMVPATCPTDDIASELSGLAADGSTPSRGVLDPPPKPAPGSSGVPGLCPACLPLSSPDNGPLPVPPGLTMFGAALKVLPTSVAADCIAC